ncbi:MAG: YraN family protein [Thermoflexales bacterium]|nr:YraN family protein [Thermoflexales bacterium]MDW8350806.1 YraN family protein [Anaerolineae bacterium]
MTKREDVGAWGEAIAAKHLTERGYVVRERNWRHGHGELDIVAQRGDTLIFVEVRTRRSDAYGRPQESISPHKRATLITTAQAYLEAHGLQDAQWQIDVIAIELDERNVASQLEHIECAIEG